MSNRMPEAKFEDELIEFLCSGSVTPASAPGEAEAFWGAVEEPSRGYLTNGESPRDYVVKTKLWEYASDIKTTDQLWDNFKRILEQHNQSTLEGPLSVTEFNQVKKVISDLHTPYQAGQFLYGLNGVSQIEINLDDGRHVFLTVFDQKQIGAGDTVYQVVNQIERPAKIAGKQNRRFDTTLLINGLPIIHIEEKRDTHDVNEALNQMHQYIDENQFRDIFSTVQILVAITPNNVKYMANTISDNFNKDFAFNWQRRCDNGIVRNWKEFADSMLSIPMAHQMATSYMILDGTKNKQALKVMRPYQVYATQKALDGLKKVDFEFGDNKVGYIWHTTGSGKTITSFKTAWLASRMPKVDKVVFLVDRIALTKQTNENYRAYDPDASEEFDGSVRDTENTTALSRQLKSKDNSIIVTSVQKLDKLIKRSSFKSPDKNIVFIVDEAHRSTGGDSFGAIQKAFKRSAWIGYTGTPMFDETTQGLRTDQIFGPLLHAYTIREAIADRNVLGFQVDFETTIPEEEMKTNYLPKFYKQQNPEWTDEQIQRKIDNMTPEDMDDEIKPSFYDDNDDHVRLVVEDIFNNWPNRSREGKYNALLTTHVGGARPSTPLAMKYYREFQRVNAQRQEENKPTLKVAVTFSQKTGNDDYQLQTNRDLAEAIDEYNNEFGTNFEMSDTSAYTQDVTARLNRTSSDKNFLDIVIVVDQLLTGFDAPELNTLYVDRTLKGAGLIQAYSRTNRIVDMQSKPWGHIVNYRWPAHSEALMNKALAIYANKDSASFTPTMLEDLKVIAPPFQKVLEDVQETVETMRELTRDFNEIPPSEAQQEELFQLLHKYNSGVEKLKQYKYDPETGDGFDFENPDALIASMGMTPDEEVSLTTVIKNELVKIISDRNEVPIQQIHIQLSMSHVKDIKVNYDYLTELVEKLLNEVHEGKSEEALTTQEAIVKFANALEDRNYATKIIQAAQAIVDGEFPGPNSDFKFPAKLDSSDAVIQEANNASLGKMLLSFRYRWGITDAVTNAQLKELFSVHRFAQQDLDDTGMLSDIITKGSNDYQELANEPYVKQLSKINYRKELRTAIYSLADTLAEF